MPEVSVDDFLVHHGVKGVRWGVQKQDAYNARITAQRKSTEAKKSDDTTPIRPVGSLKIGDVLTRILQEGYERATGPAVANYFKNAPVYRPSGNSPVDDIIARALNQSANRVESAAGESFVKNLPPGIRLL